VYRLSAAGLINMNTKGLRLPDLREPGNMDKESYIRTLYRVALQRDPDPSALTRLLARDDIESFFPEILSSAEFRRLARSAAYAATRELGLPDRRRVLLFGAYGNGNLGDAIQASSLARAINFLRPEIEVWACSALPAPYPFAHQLTLQPDAILAPAIVNSFDLLVIGGGGLLSHPHDPLTDAKWQAMLQVPVALIGVGAAEPVASKAEILIRKAIYVSGRDSHSIATLRQFAREPAFVPDPVLCDASYLNQEEHSFQRPPSDRKLWVLKYVDTEEFQAECNNISQKDDAVCFIEPHMDFRLVEHIPTARPVYFVEDLIRMIDQADLVLSMRYHGCILAILRGKHVFGLHAHKCLDLMSRYGNELSFSESISTEISNAVEYFSPATYLSDDRQIFLRELSKALAFIPGPTAICLDRRLHTRDSCQMIDRHRPEAKEI
jgi:polysaccharide pyruvyl transferase WcaK-like protein